MSNSYTEAESRRLQRSDVAVNLLVETGAVLSSSLDLATTIGRVARLTVPHLADLCVIDLRDARGSISELAVAAVDPDLARQLEALRSQFPLDPDGTHPVARVIRSGRPELLPQMSEELLSSFAQGAEHARFMIRHGYRSAVVAPLAARGHTLGALSVLRLGDNAPYEPHDLELVCELARRAGLAIDNAQLFSHVRSIERRLEAVLENLAEAITVVDAREQTVFANQAAVDLLGLGSPGELTNKRPGEIMARFLVLDETGRELGLESMPGRRLFRGETPKPLLVRNIIRATGEERWIIVRASPIVDPQNGQVMYAANVFEDVTQVKRAQLAEAFMAQASRVLASSMDYNETLQRVARLATAQIADWCTVDVLGERGQLERVTVHHADSQKLALAERLNRTYPPTLEQRVGVPEVIRTGEARMFNEISEDALTAYARDPEHLDILRQIGARDVIIVPLAAPARTLGAITLVSSHGSRRLIAADLDLAVRLGRRAGTAVESARLYTERTRIANILQQALLPDPPPDMPGFEVATCYCPAGELNEVGGDFYDVYPCGPERWMLVIGDVCGKGPAAASVTALARHTIRAASMLDARPAAMLHVLHRALCQQAPEPQMCTVCVVKVGARDSCAPITLALAGHPQPLLIDKSGAASLVGDPGTALGLVDPISIAEIELELAQGETLLLYTDGVLEAWRARPQRTPSLARLCASAPELPLADLLQRVERAVLDNAAGKPRDDVALLGLRFAGTEDV